EQEVRSVANPDITRRRWPKSQCGPIGPIIEAGQEQPRQDGAGPPPPIAIAARVMERAYPDPMEAAGAMPWPVRRKRIGGPRPSDGCTRPSSGARDHCIGD